MPYVPSHLEFLSRTGTADGGPDNICPGSVQYIHQFTLVNGRTPQKDAAPNGHRPLLAWLARIAPVRP